MGLRQKGWAAAIFIGVFWGTPWIIASPLLQAFPAHVLVTMIYGLASLGLVALSLSSFIRKTFNLNRPLWIRGVPIKEHTKLFGGLSFCGIVGQGFFSFLYFQSVNKIPSSEIGVIQGLIPIFIFFLGVILKKYKMNLWELLAVLLAFTGVYIIVIDPTFDSTGFKIEHLYCLLSAISFASSAFLRSELAESFGSVTTMFYQFLTSFIFFSIFSILLGDWPIQIAPLFQDPSLIAGFATMGIGVCSLSYLIYIFAMHQIGVNNVGMSLNLIPLSSFVVAVLVQHEAVTLLRCVGFLIVLSAMFIFVHAQSKAAN